MVVVLVKEMYKFFTQDLDKFDQWQVEEDDEPIGANVTTDHGWTYYFSFGEYNEDTDCDTYGIPDRYISWYSDKPYKLVGTHLYGWSNEIVETVDFVYE